MSDKGADAQDFAVLYEKAQAYDPLREALDRLVAANDRLIEIDRGLAVGQLWPREGTTRARRELTEAYEQARAALATEERAAKQDAAAPAPASPPAGTVATLPLDVERDVGASDLNVGRLARALEACWPGWRYGRIDDAAKIAAAYAAAGEEKP